MVTVVEFIDEVIQNFENEEILSKIATKVHDFMSHRPLFME